MFRRIAGSYTAVLTPPPRSIPHTFATLSNRIRLELLGSGRVLSSDGTVLLQGGLPLTLLAYLARVPGGVTREDLSTLFWPGRDRALALQSLRQTLTRLRKALGDAHLMAEGRFVLLDLSGIDTDLSDFEEAIAAARIGDAVSLWRGGFLSETRAADSWELEEWLDRERNRLSGMLRGGLLTAGSDALRQAEAGTMTSCTELLKALDEGCSIFPLDEDLHLLRFDLILAKGEIPRAAGLLEELRALGVDNALAARSQSLQEAERGEWDPVRGGPLPYRFATTEEGGASGVGTGKKLALFGLLLLLPLVLLLTPRNKQASPNERALSGHILLYCSNEATFRTGAGIDQLFRMNLDGSNKHQISTNPDCALYWLEAAGVGVHVVRRDEEFELLRLTPDPDNRIGVWLQSRLTSFPAELEPIQAEHMGGLGIIDDRYLVLPGRSVNGDSLLVLVDPVADTSRILTSGGATARDPVWDPELRELVYASDRGGRHSIWALDPFAEILTPVQLTDSPSEDKRPAVHSGRVLFVRGLGTGPTKGDYAIWMLDRRTGVEEVLVSRPWNDFMARWSPDGKHFCWVSTELGHFESDIWVMDLATRTMRNLTPDLPGRSYECMWGPDSETVFFSSAATGWAQLQRTNRQGTFRENISRNPGEAEPRMIVPRSVIDPR